MSASSRIPDSAAGPSYLTSGTTVRSWLFTLDHKRIAILYLFTITFFFLIGATAAGLMRWQLAAPAAELVTSDAYNRLFTLHGVVMVWFFLIPSIPSVIGNFVLPLAIGARDVAFPRLNLASWYIFLGGGALGALRDHRGLGWTPAGRSTPPA